MTVHPHICFDIETCAIDDAATFLEPVSAPSNYKDPSKIAAFIADKTADEVDRCALDLDLCRIVAIGWQWEGTHPVTLLADTMSEAEMIRSFWESTNQAHLVGFNCLQFDLPVLFRRSLYLGVEAPIHAYELNKYRPVNVTDLQQVLSYNGAVRYRGLSFYAKRFGFDVADDFTGEDIPGLIHQGRWEDVRSHLAADLEKTARLAERLGVFRPATVTT